jgi:hypothetical protein
MADRATEDHLIETEQSSLPLTPRLACRTVQLFFPLGALLGWVGIFSGPPMDGLLETYSCFRRPAPDAGS